MAKKPNGKDVWAISNMIDRVLDHSLDMEDKEVARRAILDAVGMMDTPDPDAKTFKDFAVACERAAAGFLRLAWAARNAGERATKARRRGRKG